MKKTKMMKKTGHSKGNANPKMPPQTKDKRTVAQSSAPDMKKLAARLDKKGF